MIETLNKYKKKSYFYVFAIWLIAMGIAVTAFATPATVSGSGKIYDDNNVAVLEYATSGALTGEGSVLSKRNSAAKATLAADASGIQRVLTISATPSSYYYKKDSCTGAETIEYAATTTATVTIKNPASATNAVTITSITASADSANITISSSLPRKLSPGESIAISLSASPDSSEDTTVSDDVKTATVTIVAESVQNSTLTLIASDLISYSAEMSDGQSFHVAMNGENIEAPTASGTTVTMSAAPSINGYIFYGWRLSSGALVADGGSFVLSSDLSVSPVYLDSSKYSYSDGNFSYTNASNQSSTGPFKVSDVRYLFWTDAVYAALSTGGDIILVENYPFPQTYADNGVMAAGSYVSGSNNALTYTLPAGVTLLLPYSTTDTSIKSGTSQTDDFKHANVSFGKNVAVSNTAAMDPNKAGTVTYTLTIPENCTLSVADGTAATAGNCGRIVVGGTIVGYEGNASSRFENATYGAHSNLVVNGTLNLGNYAVLSVTGYVLGDGMVSTEGTGAEIYQPLVIHDWRGAGVAPLFVNSSLNKKVTIQSGESEVSPYSYWATQNIQSYMTIDSGNFMYCYASLLESDAYCSHPLFVGTSDSGGLLQLATDATLTSTYQKIDWGVTTSYGFPGKTIVTINGGAKLGSMTLYVKLTLGSMNVDTAAMTLPISYCYDFVLNTGDYYVDNAIALLPGATLTVNKGATLHVGENLTTEKAKTFRFAVFDGLNNRVSQHNGATLAYKENTRANEKNYPTTSELQKAKIGAKSLGGDAELIVNGKLVIGASASFGGLVQTTGTGIIDTKGTKDATINAFVQIGVVGQNTVNLSSRYVAGMTLHQLSARVISAKTGEITNILRGYVYGGAPGTYTQESYSFKYYPNSGNVSYVVLVGDATLASGETLVAADGTTTDGATAQTAHPLNETICGKWAVGPQVVATNIAVNDALDMFFYIDPGILPYYSNAYATINGGENIILSSCEEKDAYKRFSFSDIAAKEMCDTITVRIYDGTSSDPCFVLETSVKDYADTLSRYLKDHPDTTNATNLQTAMEAMLNYGAAAQKYYDYNTENLANPALDSVTFDKATSSITGSCSIDKAWGSRLQLINKFGMHFTVSGITMDTAANPMCATISVDNGTAVPLTWIVQEEGKDASGKTIFRYFFSTEATNALSIADAQKKLTVVIYNSAQPDANKIYCTITDSVASYVVRMLAGEAQYGIDDSGKFQLNNGLQREKLGQLTTLLNALMEFSASAANCVGGYVLHE